MHQPVRGGVDRERRPEGDRRIERRSINGTSAACSPSVSTRSAICDWSL
jgi:hypothetical protein